MRHFNLKGNRGFKPKPPGISEISKRILAFLYAKKVHGGAPQTPRRIRQMTGATVSDLKELLGTGRIVRVEDRSAYPMGLYALTAKGRNIAHGVRRWSSSDTHLDTLDCEDGPRNRREGRR